METALKGKCGTRGYWAPEMVRGSQYLYSVDWWSLGVTLVELLTGKKPFKKKFQKYKTTDDKVCVCAAGEMDDEIEEKGIAEKARRSRHTRRVTTLPVTRVEQVTRDSSEKGG